MAKREIMRAAEAAGVKITGIQWEWTPTPGEMVPCWSIYFDFDDSDRLGIDTFHQFDNSIQAVEWLKSLKGETIRCGAPKDERNLTACHLQAAHSGPHEYS